MKEITKQDIKGEYSPGLPRFILHTMSYTDIENHKTKSVVAFRMSKIHNTESIVISVKPDRIHVYVLFEERLQELKYNPFNEDKYCSIIGKYDTVLRERIPNKVLFGSFYCDLNRIEIFHIWDPAKKRWLGIKEITSYDIGYSDDLIIPRKYIEGPLWHVKGLFEEDIQNDYFVMDFNDSGKFWMYCR